MRDVVDHPPAVKVALARRVTWHSAIIVALGAALLVTVSLGPMTGELGRVAPFVWLFTAFVGALQCLLLVELAAAFPERAGGTATYVHSAFGGRLPLMGAVSSWGYWFAWTPGVAVNLILAAACLRATVWHGLDVLPSAIAGGVVLYAANALGLRVSMRVAGCIALVAVASLLLILGGALIHAGEIHVARVDAAHITRQSGSPDWSLARLAKWTFVAAWSAYGAEIASTVIAEMRGPQSGASHALLGAAGIGLLMFGAVPFIALALVGVYALAADPLTAFLPIAQAGFSDTGRPLVGVMFASGLALGALAFIVGSSRTVYQMAEDGYLPREMAAVNKRGVPIGSLALDAAIMLLLLTIFGLHVVDVVAAANIGYLVVFVLIPIAYLALHRGREPARRKPALAYLAAALVVFNAALLVVGALQWGGGVMVTGTTVMMLVLPVWLLRRLQDRRISHRRRGRATANAS